jgi:hypothetical protein
MQEYKRLVSAVLLRRIASPSPIMGHVTPTPVPYKKLMPLAIIYFIEAFVFTNIFSYIGFMVNF